MKRIWIVSELYYPNESATAYILTEIAKKFVSAFEVNVICADTNYENDSNRITKENEMLMAGINTKRVSVPELDKNSLFKRLIRLLSVSTKLYHVAEQNVKADDLVFVVTNPAFLLPYMARLKKKKKVDYVLLVHDVFPENALASGVMKVKPLYYIIKMLFDKAYSAADRIIVLGEDMKEIVAQKTGRVDNVFICENWGASSITPIVRTNDGKIIFQFAGNIGRVQGLEELINTIRSVHNPHLIFDFWGSGALVSRLSNLVEQNKLSNVRLRGSYSRGNQNDVLNSCDIAIICLANGMKGLGVPSKTYNIMAAGKPILFIGDRGSEIYNLVRDNDIGVAFNWNQREELISWLENLNLEDLVDLREKGKRARALYEKRFTQEIILNKALGIVQKSS